MSPATRNSICRRRPLAWVAGALGCAALLLSGAVVVGAASTKAIAATAPACSAEHLEVWLGDGEGGGTLGSIYYPLEFSNTGHSNCVLDGYPGVSAWGQNGKQVGLPAQRAASAHSSVTLAPGATAHALVQFVEWGAVCSKGVHALGLRVYAPGLKQAQPISFAFEVCAHASVLRVGPVRAGVAIPAYTAP